MEKNKDEELLRERVEQLLNRKVRITTTISIEDRKMLNKLGITYASVISQFCESRRKKQQVKTIDNITKKIMERVK